MNGELDGIYTYVHNIIPFETNKLERIHTYICCVLSDPLNARSLHDIETAMFMVSLDMPHPQMDSLKPDDPYTDAHATILTNRALHGNGSDFNTSNRWFDMASQVGTSKYSSYVSLASWP